MSAASGCNVSDPFLAGKMVQPGDRINILWRKKAHQIGALMV
jgi:hypothetical protein